MQGDPNLIAALLQGKTSNPEVIKPGDTGDDNVLPPDPGYMGQQPPFLNVSVKKPNG